MIGVKRQDKIKLRHIRGKTNITDVTYIIKKFKWKWVGHFMRRKKENWAKDITEWYPRDGKRRKGRPFRRWEDDLRETAGPLWTRKTHNREAWKNLGKAYAKQDDQA
ncbi:jg5014 [Pararge aegeria aegeria]|uniref:Jg5014 protein n=1 Tax=Pararge aegeria aegeria TaxID=348720 RepID=A0A8S4RBW3_9NEOP|nr:jg5014 [Pararge aegeria aegeria]